MSKEIRVEKASHDKLIKLNVHSWPIWQKGVSRFPWTYDSIEECYFLEGELNVNVEGKKPVTITKGDFVTFPKGLSCTWVISKPVRKHYNFK
jgi:uncharacterized cupin superfamily protein